MSTKPILVLDFDGVMHSYTSGWQGIETCNDPPVPGLATFLEAALQHFDVHVHSSRSSDATGRAAMRRWCVKELGLDLSAHLSFPRDKPPAMVTLDDRALTFTGEWPDIMTLWAFQPWTRHTAPPNEAPQATAPAVRSPA